MENTCYFSFEVTNMSKNNHRQKANSNKGSSIKYVCKIFRKTNISNPLYVRVRIRGLEMLVFRKILRTYLMDGP